MITAVQAAPFIQTQSSVGLTSGLTEKRDNRPIEKSSNASVGDQSLGQENGQNKDQEVVEVNSSSEFNEKSPKVEMGFDDQSGRLFIEYLDQKTGETINRFPPKLKDLEKLSQETDQSRLLDATA